MGKLIIILLGCICVTLAQGFHFKPPYEYKRTALGDSIDASTMKILESAYKHAADKNLVSSPLGLMTLLSLYSEGAGPRTKREITKFLGGGAVKQVSEAYKNLTVKFSEMSPKYLTVADKIVVSDNYKLDETFDSYAKAYHCEFEALDFSNPEEAADDINKWAAEKTEGHISHPVTPEMITPDIAAALFNVIFFKGHWHVPFKAEETKEKDFHISRKVVVKKPMMHLYKSLFYTESKKLGARMIELPYKEKGFRMVVILPNKIDGLHEVLKRASKRGILSDVFKLRPAYRDVELDMPKFDVRTKLDFNEILPKVGIKKIFEEGAPGIVMGADVVASRIFQEAFITVDEKGATAGAFTGLIPVALSYPAEIPRPLKFTVDHPFLYAILYEDKILFVGTYSG